MVHPPVILSGLWNVYGGVKPASLRSEWQPVNCPERRISCVKIWMTGTTITGFTTVHFLI